VLVLSSHPRDHSIHDDLRSGDRLLVTTRDVSGRADRGAGRAMDAVHDGGSLAGKESSSVASMSACVM